MEIWRGVRRGLEGKGSEEMERERSRCREDLGRRRFEREGRSGEDGEGSRGKRKRVREMREAVEARG